VSYRCISTFLLLFLGTSFDLSFCSKWLSRLSSSGAQVPIMLPLAWAGDDIFAATMPPPKPSIQLGGFSMKRRTAR
jgi:hypothetical protein